MQALNYPAAAARSLRKFIDEGRSKNFNGEFDPDIDACERLLGLLQMDICQHFQMPEGGHIFDDKLKGIRGRAIRLPYPLISVSYHCGPEHTFLGETYDSSQLIPVPKRVTVAIELPREKLPEGKQDIFPGCQRVCMVMALFSEGDEWRPCMSVALFPTDRWDGTGYEGDTFDPPAILKEPGGASFIARVSIMLPHFFNLATMAHGRDYAERSSYHDIGGEVAVVLELCEALTCTNVRSSVIQRAKPGLNARRARDGKLPILETKMLTVEVPIRHGATPHRGGTHATPIGMQLCRGHIRGWPKDPTRNMWIEDYARGDASKGVIKKTYAVTT